MPGIKDINWVYYKYYADNPELKRIVMVHSDQVAKKALEICKKKKLELNIQDVYCAAMLHDIGVVKCNAAGIYAHGKAPYIQHGLEGKKILDANGLSQYSNICTNHTGAGITKEEIKNNNLPLPLADMTPKTLLEKLICYSDKFFSKSHDLLKEKPLEEVKNQMKKFGEETYSRFMSLHSLFSYDNK